MTNKNHFIPEFILKYFKNPGTDSQVSYLILQSNEIKDKNSSSLDKYYNIRNFYSTEPLNSVINSDYIGINPVFERNDLNLEKNLSFIESNVSNIILKIINNIDVKLTPKEIAYLKEYLVIQHLRTKKFKEDFENFPIEFPDDPEEKIRENILEEDRRGESNIRIKEAFKEKFPDKNAKERREPYRQFLKLKKRNPDLLIESLEKTPEIEKLIQKARQLFNKAYNSDNSHSIAIINKENRDNYFKETMLDSLNFNILINKSPEEFLLTDAGVSINKKGDCIYLPITPKICIAFTKKTEKKRNLDVDEVRAVNRLSKEESRFVLFGTKTQLELFKKHTRSV